MEPSKIKINYLYNSGFIVETENNLLIFDYYLDNAHDKDKHVQNGYIGAKDISTNKKIFVFSSHSHYDHFNPVIFTWKQFNNNINYILSSDIRSKKDDSIHYLAPYGNICIDNVQIKTFGSTDLGVSFHVFVDEVSIFHAGDLNWWDWYDEPEENNLKMEQDFKNEISKIKAEKIDIGFFPVDPRLKESYYLGGEYFIKAVNPKLFIPMHFGNNFKITKEFSDRFKDLNCRIAAIKSRGQLIE